MLHDWLNMLLKQTFFTCHSLAKHDYISRASERAKLFFLFRFIMAVSRTKEYKEGKKLEYKYTIREGTFVADYIKTKYPAMYEEAATFYNSINKLHPTKPNLRKTMEYRMWKNEMAQANNQPLQPIPRQRDRFIKPTEYRNITTEINNTGETPTSPNQTNQLAGDKQFTLEIPLMTQSETVITQANQGEQPEIHEMEEGQQPETHDIQEGEQPQMHVSEEGAPLENIDPSLMDVVPPDVVEKIIADLQRDPSLKQIMDDLENEYVHEEIMGLEIDIPDLQDPLEDELENLLW